MTVACLLASPWVLGPAVQHHGIPNIPEAWIAGPVLAWAISGGRRRGAAAAVLVGVCDIVSRPSGANHIAVSGTVLMLLAAIAVGYLARLAEASQERLQRAAEMRRRPGSGSGWPATSTTRCCRCSRWSSGAAPSWTGRRASWPGWPASRRRRCAIWSAGAARCGPSGRRGRPDGPARAGWRRPRCRWRRPADPVALPRPHGPRAGRGGRRGAGQRGAALPRPATKAWVLVEEEPGAVTVTRARRRRRASRRTGWTRPRPQGRLGVAQSIRGRMRDLGGRVQITSAPGQGTEVEMVPGAAIVTAVTHRYG